MTYDEWFELTEKYDPEYGPWKWGHTETITTDDGRIVTAFVHCQEGVQEIYVSKVKDE